MRHRSDSNREAIVEALRDAGAWVFVIERPVDLLVRFGTVWAPAEVKPPHWKPLRIQQKQTNLIRALGVEILTSPEQAIAWLSTFHAHQRPKAETLSATTGA